MKITKTQLRNIIKEELDKQNALAEGLAMPKIAFDYVQVLDTYYQWPIVIDGKARGKLRMYSSWDAGWEVITSYDEQLRDLRVDIPDGALVPEAKELTKTAILKHLETPK